MAIPNKLVIGSLVAVTSLSAFVLMSTTASADGEPYSETYTKSALIRVASACTLSGAVATPHTKSVAISTYESNIGETVFSGVCNDSGGFAVYAIGYTNDTDGNNKLVHSTDSSLFINTGTAESGNTSAWAMKLTAVENAATPTILNDYDDYNVVPDDYVKVASYPSVTTASASSMFKSYYAVYVSPTQPAGTYEGKVKYVMVHPSTAAAPTFENAFAAAGKTKATIGGKQYYAMQDMNSSICDSVEVSNATQLYDNRDNKIYWIAKLKDGHCWMTQNLDLDLETTPNHVLALTSENTDLNTFGSNGYDTSNGYSKDANNVITWTPERNTIPTSSISTTGTITGWTNDYNNPYSIDTGDWYWIGNWKNNGTDTWYTSTTNNYLDRDNFGAGDKFSTNEYAGNGKHGHVGNYYNWSATIASNNSSSYNASTLADITTNPQNSICPSGWRLPTVSNASDTDGSTNEFRRLVTLYGNTTGNDKALTAAPLWFVRGGNVYSSSLYNSGYYGFYWSSTVDNSYDAYNLNFYSSNVDPALSSVRRHGWSVRCIAR